MALFAISAAVLAFMLVLPAPAGAAAETGHLQEGIRFYNTGRYDEALSEFNAQVQNNPRCPLAYYYAARIRIAREQFTRAEKNLLSAFRDSTGFHDSQALLAVVYLNLGRENDALAAWEQFVSVEGKLDGSRAARIDDIMFPEEYRALAEQKRLEKERQERLAAEKRERERIEAEKREKERLAAEQREKERLAAEKHAREQREAEEKRLAETAIQHEGDDTGKQAERVEITDSELTDSPDADISVTAETPPETLTEDDITTPFEDIEQRIRSTIRTGFYGLAAIIFTLTAGIAGTRYVRKKRRLAGEETHFTDEVERLMLDREFELSEEQAIRELDARERGIISEERTIMKPVFRPETINDMPAPDAEETPPEMREKSRASEYTRDTCMTEEVKSLVSKLYREGKLPEEIANIADLTKTEVALILAVRERHLSDLIDDIHADDDVLDRDDLFQAIQTLSFEGAGSREIARRLNISLSEVELASSVLAMKKQNSG